MTDVVSTEDKIKVLGECARSYDKGRAWYNKLIMMNLLRIEGLVEQYRPKQFGARRRSLPWRPTGAGRKVLATENKND